MAVRRFSLHRNTPHAVMRRFSNIGVSAARYRITTAKMFAKCADFHVLESLRPYADTPFLDEKLTRLTAVKVEIKK